MTERKEIVRDVERVYEEPRNVLEDGDLSTEDKIRVLENWKNDLLQLQRASDENMPSTDVRAGAAADRLTQVAEALEGLRKGGAG